MDFISTSQDLENTFLRLCSTYNHYKWSVAWAGYDGNFSVFKTLKKNQKKIERLIVGLHFYQTNPLFIEHYMHNKHVRFIMSAEGTFHPKIYLFYNNENEWSALIGSSNLTCAGFSKNTEANILINGNESNRGLFEKINSFIDICWNDAREMTEKELNVYSEHAKNFKSKLSSLKRITFDSHNKLNNAPLCYWNWDEFANRIKSEKFSTLDERLQILKEAYSLFNNHLSFKDIEYSDRRKLAGFHEIKPNEELDWKLFGSMKGAGFYKTAIKNLNEAILAIDDIPISGTITRELFLSYAQSYEKIFRKNMLACGTRLLAMKRPDVFLCVDEKNKKSLCRTLGISPNTLTLESYWDLIIEPIQSSIWYNTPRGSLSKLDKMIWDNRVALLDCAFYEHII